MTLSSVRQRGVRSNKETRDGMQDDDGEGIGRVGTLPTWRLIICTLTFAGIQVGYSAQANLGTSQLLLLGMSESRVSLVWLAGPISGLVMQPLVGYLSDRCTWRMGRRRPFIAVGAICTALSLLLFSNAARVARFIGLAKHAPPDVGREQTDSGALAVAIVAFFLLDFSLQVQAPARTLVFEAVPRGQRATANAWVAAFAAIGNLFAGFLAATRLSRILPVFSTDAHAFFALSVLFLALTTAPSIFITREALPSSPGVTRGKREGGRGDRDGDGDGDGDGDDGGFDGDDGGFDGDVKDVGAIGSGGEDSGDVGKTINRRLLRHERDKALSTGTGTSSSALTPPRLKAASGWRASWHSLWAAPRPFWQVFGVQLCTWSGFFTIAVYANAWVGRNVYGGDGTAPGASAQRAVFEAGVRLGGIANALASVVSLVFSAALPPLMRKLGARRVYVISQAVETASLCLPLVLVAPRGSGARHLARDAVKAAAQTTTMTPSLPLKVAAVSTLASFGVVSAATTCIPWMIAGEALERQPFYARRLGFFLTIFNASQSFPQLVMGLVTPAVLAVAGNDPAAVMFCAGILAAAGAVLIVLLRVDTFDNGETVTLTQQDLSNDKKKGIKTFEV